MPAYSVAHAGPVSDSCRSLLAGPAGLITQHFTAAEFACPCCGRVVIERTLVNLLELARMESEAPLIVCSGFRCPVHNASLPGSSPRSWHTVGLAADVRSSTLSPWALANILARAGRALALRAVLVYPGFVHVDRGVFRG